MGSLEILTKSKVLKKPTSAVHSAGQLSLLQRKISNSLLYHAYDQLLETEEHEITVGELCQLINYSGNNYAVIKQSLKGLISTVVEWNILDEDTGEEDWSASSILASVRIKGARCYYAYSPRMRELLASPSMYAKINLYIQSRFHSSYGLALYENCTRYRNLHSTKWFDTGQFRRLMGVGEDKYKIFKDFKKRVIDKAIDEVNTYSDLHIKVAYAKVGRRVVKLRFLLNERPKKARLGVPVILASKQTKLAQIIQKEFGLSVLHTDRLLSQYEETYLAEKVDYVKSTKLFKGDKAKEGSLAAYFVSAVKNDYKQSKMTEGPSLDKKAEQEKQQAKKQKQLEQYRRYCVGKLKEIIEGLNKQRRESVLASFEKSISRSIYGETFKKEGVTNPLVQDQFYLFARKTKIDLLNQLPTMEEYFDQLENSSS